MNSERRVIRFSGLSALTFVLAALQALPLRAEVAVPPLQARVMDLTGTLAPEQRSALEPKLAAFEQQKGSQLAVLIVSTTRPETIELYGIRVAEQWKLGRKGVDDGAVLLVAKDDRELRIEVGYGLEGPLPDAISKRIVSEVYNSRSGNVAWLSAIFSRDRPFSVVPRAGNGLFVRIKS